MPSDADFDPEEEDADGYLRRAELLAELGRYGEAADELAAATTPSAGSPSAPDPPGTPGSPTAGSPDAAGVGGRAPADPRLAAMLSRIWLRAGEPERALAAAESALVAYRSAPPPVGSGGGEAELRVLALRGYALVELGRFGEAAAVADELLARGPVDPYAQRAGAAILADARNGQRALDAAWRAVELTPADSLSHLVLALVAARLGLYDLAERAYREALRLDPDLDAAGQDVGVLRLERRRWSLALEEATTGLVIHPAPQRQQRRDVGEALRQLVLFGAGYGIVAAVLIAFTATTAGLGSRVFAVLLALGGALLVWRLAARVPGLRREVLPRLARADRPLALAVYAAGAGPALVALYALVGTPWPLVLAIAVGCAAELVAFTRSRR